MRRAFLTRLLEIVVEHTLHVQRRVTSSHRENTLGLLDNDQPTVFVHDLHPAALETPLVALGLAHGNLHALLQREIKLRHRLSVDLDAPSLQCGLDLRLRLRHIRQQPLEQRHRLGDDEMVVLSLTIISCVVSHIC